MKEHAIRFGSFVARAERWDAVAFGVSEAEASLIDPQQRLLLECSAEVLMAARWAFHLSTQMLTSVHVCCLSDLHNFPTTFPLRHPAFSSSHSDWGSYIGASSTDYLRLAISLSASSTAYAATSGTLSVASGRISYTFGLRGPAVTVDTACSSSLVACQAAAVALRMGFCGGAVVGGVNLTLLPDTPIMFQKAGKREICS
jgi:acyl transferase domain-containing protein